MNIPIAIVVLVVLFLKVPESKGELAKCKIDYLGAILVTLGLGGIIYGLIESAALGFSDPTVFGSLILGVALLVAFIIVENKVEAPMMPLKLFKSKTFSGVNLLSFLMYAQLGGALFFLPFAEIQVFDYTPTGAGASFLPIIILLFVFSRWSGGLVDKYGAKYPLVIGSLIQAVGYVLFALLSGEGNYFYTFFPGMFVLGLGLALSVAPQTTAVMNAVDTTYSGTASGINSAVARVSGLIAIALLGIVMLYLFSSGMNNGMDIHDAPEEIQIALKGEYLNMADAKIPLGIAPEIKNKIKELVEISYVSSFNVIMYISSVFCLLRALVAWLFVQDEQRFKNKT
jgi:hypothetical protein